MSTAIEIPPGTKFGNWKVIKLIRYYDGRGVSCRKYLCVCKCGVENLIYSQALRERKTRKCLKCMGRDNAKEGNSRWTGHGDISGYHWSRIRSIAAKRNIPFDIDIEQAWELFLEQNCRCALTGMAINFDRIKGRPTGTASLDRISSKKGYVIGNLQWVHKDINLMKRDLGQRRFIRLCSMVAKNAE